VKVAVKVSEQQDLDQENQQIEQIEQINIIIDNKKEMESEKQLEKDNLITEFQDKAPQEYIYFLVLAGTVLLILLVIVVKCMKMINKAINSEHEHKDNVIVFAIICTCI